MNTLYRPPRPRRHALRVWFRNLLVWRKLIVPAVLMNFGEPLIYLFGFGLGLGAFITHMDGLDYLPFLASGIMASATLTSAAFEGMYSVYTRMDPQRSYDAMLATVLDIDDIILGEALWCASKATLSGSAILAIALIAGWAHGPQALLAIPIFFLLGLAIAGPAIVMAAYARGYDFFQYFFTLIITPMLMLSGVFFPLSQLPELIQGLIHLLPLVHAVELIRPLVTDTGTTHIATHLSVLIAYATLGIYAATIASRRRFKI